jgi:hypothetical protein
MDLDRLTVAAKPLEHRCASPGSRHCWQAGAVHDLEGGGVLALAGVDACERHGEARLLGIDGESLLQQALRDSDALLLEEAARHTHGAQRCAKDWRARQP